MKMINHICLTFNIIVFFVAAVVHCGDFMTNVCIDGDGRCSNTATNASYADDSSTTDNTEYLSNDLPIVILDFNDLTHEELNPKLETAIKIAYGPSGLGLLLVKNVPNLGEKREQMLHFARNIAYLPTHEKASLEDKESVYAFGYSHGKEVISKGKPDWRKMSFYANPIIDDPTNMNQSLMENHPSFYRLNIWPTETEAAEMHNFLVGFRETFRDLGQLMFNTGQAIAYHMDSYVTNSYLHPCSTSANNTINNESEGNYQRHTLTNAVGTNVPKARLLYYFSDREMVENGFGHGHGSKAGYDAKNDEISEISEISETNDGWCSWHNDHSCLTALVLGMFFDHDGNEVEVGAEAGTGLFVKTRDNITHHIHLNRTAAAEYLAFQIGETSQILSGGKLVATPHAVMVDEQSQVSRASFALFMQPHPWHHMRAPANLESIESVQFDRYLPPRVPTLASRWCNQTGDTFGEFSRRTFATYYT